MTIRKKVFYFVALVIMAACLSAALFTFQPKTAETSRSSSGTNTDGEWSGSQTTGNLITIGGTYHIIKRLQRGASAACRKWRECADRGFLIII